MIEIQRHVRFAGVQIEEIAAALDAWRVLDEGRSIPQAVQVRPRLDADDFSPEIGQVFGQQGAHPHPGEIDDTQPSQGLLMHL